MTSLRPILLPAALAALLAGALFFGLLLTPEFISNSNTPEHPVIAFSACLILASTAWLGIVLSLRKSKISGGVILSASLLLGLGLRLMFFGSTPVYENDYKRYLWDGAVTASGENPYQYSPSEIHKAGAPRASSVPDLARLAIRSNEADYLTSKVNSPTLTTIYPPAAQVVFAAAYWIAPYKPWGLQLVFLLFEIAGGLALLAGLRARSLPLIWSAAYWLNPIIIFTTYNGVHMDVLLVAPIIASLLYVGRHPFRAAIFLSIAGAIKIWPLLLAPVLFRGWRHRPAIYIGVAALVGLLTLASLYPMLRPIISDYYGSYNLTGKANSGLAAYSANWTNSSFLYPGLRDAIGLVFENSDRLARYTVAIILTGFSLWLGFIKPQDKSKIPAHLLILSAAFVLLSPTGYPWYFIWFLMFLPFTMNHWSTRGLALLSIGAAAYYARFQLGETGRYYIYEKVLLPLEFGLPLLVLAWDELKAKRHA